MLGAIASEIKYSSQGTENAERTTCGAGNLCADSHTEADMRKDSAYPSK